MKTAVRHQALASSLPALLAMLPAAVWAQAPELPAGNLTPGFYSHPSCLAPDKPAGKPVYTDPQDVAVYNLRVMRFNKAVAAFNACIKAYGENADRDIERILSAVNGAVAEVQGNAPPPPPTAPGNMPVDFYPASPCIKPDPGSLGMQPPATDSKAMAAYNLRVTAFNDQAKTFTDCLKAYQAKAQRDIAQIRVAVRDAAAAQ